MGNYFTEASLERRDLSLAALLLWIRLTLTALSKAEKTADKFLVLGLFRAVFRSFLTTFVLALFRAVLVLSFLTFLIADLMIGTASIVAQALAFAQAPLLQLKSYGEKSPFLAFYSPDFDFIRGSGTDGNCCCC